jgi:two-component system chemotaxis response regulator CheY
LLDCNNIVLVFLPFTDNAVKVRYSIFRCSVWKTNQNSIPLSPTLYVTPIFTLIKGEMPVKLTALVVDDSRVMRNMVKQSLQRTEIADFNFVEAGDGVEALTKFDPHLIDLALVDINMPRMDGINFVTKVREMNNGREVPIIIITSEKTVATMEAALDVAGANAYICKPFTVDELKWKVDKVINR